MRELGGAAMVCGETLARLHEDLRMATWGAKGGGVAGLRASLGSLQLGFLCVSRSLALPDFWLRTLLTIE